MNFTSKVKLLSLGIAICFAALLYPKVARVGSPDLKVFHTAAQFALADPLLIYRESPDRFLYPPVAAMAFTPIALLEFEAARLIWYLFQWGLVFLIARLLSRQTGIWWIGLASFGILSRYLMINFTYGQVNLLLLYLILVASQRLRHPGSAGSALGLATLLKIFPVVGLVSDWRLRRKLKMFSFGATLVVGALIPLAVYGPAKGLELHWQWLAQLEDKGNPLYSHNQSLSALTTRLLTGQDFLLFGTSQHWNISLAQWDPQIAAAVGSIVGFAIGLVILWQNVWLGIPQAAGLGLACLWMSHIVWKPYFVFLLPTVVLILFHRRWGYLPFLLLAGPLVSGDIVPKIWADKFDGLSGHQLATLVATIAWWRLRKLTI